jgi:hypothetical protein
VQLLEIGIYLYGRGSAVDMTEAWPSSIILYTSPNPWKRYEYVVATRAFITSPARRLTATILAAINRQQRAATVYSHLWNGFGTSNLVAYSTYIQNKIHILRAMKTAMLQQRTHWGRLEHVIPVARLKLFCCLASKRSSR